MSGLAGHAGTHATVLHRTNQTRQDWRMQRESPRSPAIRTYLDGPPHFAIHGLSYANVLTPRTLAPQAETARRVVEQGSQARPSRGSDLWGCNA